MTARPPLWRDLRVIRAAAQVAALAAVGLLLYVLWFNLTNNLRRLGITTGFDFLDLPSGVNVADNPISPGAPLRRTLLVGIKNTFALVVVGIPLLTVIGVLVGVARLSTNWLVAKAAAIYVETLRNIPPLLVIFFVFFAVILQLPPPRTPLVFGGLVVSNLRITVPWVEAGPGADLYGWALVGGLLVAGAVAWWRTRVYERTGRPHHRVLWAISILGVVAVAGWFLLDGPVRPSLPVVDGQRVSGGFSGLGAYYAMLSALVLYTASHVAEIVRGSILAVPKGQTEAALALALSPFQRLRHVILPQAMRIAIPPIISQYLNYTKNTSLGIAVGYAEITLIVFQAIGNGRPAPQSILLLMGAYLVFSLTISALVNYLNRRLRYVTN
jgi:general L-amino acid transport system permease protein